MRRVFLKSGEQSFVGFIFTDGMLAFKCDSIEDAINNESCFGYSSAKKAKRLHGDATFCQFNKDDWDSVDEIGAIKIARQRAHLSQREMASYFNIPSRTIEHWESGDRSCPEWAEALIVEKLNRLKDGPAIASAIARQIDRLWGELHAPAPGTNLDLLEGDILALCEEYFVARGRRGFVSNIAGMDGEPSTVDAISQMTWDHRAARRSEK